MALNALQKMAAVLSYIVENQNKIAMASIIIRHLLL